MKIEITRGIKMKLFIFTTIMLLFITGCASTGYIKNYDNSNPIKVEEATKGLKINELIPASKELNGTISIKSIELDLTHHLDVGVVYMIEDNLITNLLENGYKVLERDPEALMNIFRESSSKYKKRNPKYNNSMELSNPLNLNASLSEGASININNKDNKEIDNNNLIKEELKLTEINSADYMLSYRVLECGVIYDEVPNGSTKDYQKVERRARTRLHCRLTNTKTSEIISAGIVENEIKDIINKEDIDDLEQISYEYYHHTLPNQNLAAYGLTKDSGYSYVNEKPEINKKIKKQKKVVCYLI